MTWLRWFAEGIYPRAGWKRAASYVFHRIRRLPDSPGKIARGIGIGVFVSFTPFFGLHFIIATFLALLFRGNILAALLATFFGNPLTFPLIAGGSLSIGHWLLGAQSHARADETLLQLFRDASWDFWRNFMALF
ncbi:MAG: DUF2062 domain-containing protein, partial [Paracoccaceae bacterium]